MKKIFFIVFLVIFLIATFNCVGEVSIEKKLLKLFWKYDEAFAVKEEIVYGIEKVSKLYPSEIFTVDEVSEKYRKDAQKVLQDATETIKKQINNFKELYNCSVNERGYCITSPAALLSPEYNEEYQIFNKLKPFYEESILLKYKNCVRIIYSIRMTSVFQLAKEISNNYYAYTPYWPDSELTLWSDYYMHAEYAPNQTYKIVENYVIKYPYWFYESNLKLIVVVQVRDEAGNYYGELRVDLYKFDNYDELFDKEGNPKVKK